MTDESALESLEDKLAYRFGDRGLLRQALSHSSYVNENPQEGVGSNERLEFLGDAVLQLVITRYLYDDYPLCSEGELTLMRSVLVSEGTLAGIAKALGIGECLYLGKGEAASGGDERKSNLSNAFEAVAAAVYLDGGFQEAERVIRLSFAREMEKIESRRDKLNYKNLLQHYSQAREEGIPEYFLSGSFGPPHERLFEVEVKIGGEMMGKGNGRNKKEAEQEAARRALIALGELRANP